MSKEVTNQITGYFYQSFVEPFIFIGLALLVSLLFLAAMFISSKLGGKGQRGMV